MGWGEGEQVPLHQWLAVPEHGTVLEIGAGTAVATVRAFSNARQRSGWRVVRVNPECRTNANPKAVELRMTAGEFFEAISMLEGPQP